MKRVILPFGILVAASLSMAACATAANSGSALLPDGGTASSDGGAPQEQESPDDPPHALGVIALAESHLTEASKTTPSVTAAFTPDSTTLAASSCGEDVDGCTILAKPDCGAADAGPFGGGGTGCSATETCVLDDNCKSVCKPLARCSPSCDDGQECKVVDDTPTCVDSVDFNAGVIVLSGDGATHGMTLRPPSYALGLGDDDAPFVPAATVDVSVSGAVDLGFDKFTDSFTTTTLIEPNPSLKKQLDRSVVFESSDSIPINWRAGNDQITITVSGAKGSAVCKADDSSGSFAVTRSVISKVYDASSSVTSSAAISFAIARSRTEVRKDKKTIGSIDGQDVPVGYMRFVTSSTETYTAQGCASGQDYCAASTSTSAGCTNLLVDRYNCGSCGSTCTYSCVNGKCN